MSSSVHSGLQSCSERRRKQPRSSRLNPDPQKPELSNTILENFRALAMEIKNEIQEEEENKKVNSSGKDCNKKTQKKFEIGECSFLQCLSSSSKIIETENKEDEIYVHPLYKSSSSSSSILNLKSLELCTESLGSENGSEESESSSKEESHRVWSPETQKSHRKQSLKSKRVKNRACFPPPIRTHHGGVRIKSHRENGRLVMKAEVGHCCRSYFQAERGNGRLRLRLMTMNWSANKGDKEDEDIEGNSEIVEGEMRIEKFPLPGRCKERGTGRRSGLSRAEPFWVAATLGSV